jgi:RecA-family ATPase
VNYSNRHELPPVDAYEDEAPYSAADAAGAPQDGEAPRPDQPTFAAETSPYWRTDDSSDWVEADLPQRQWIVPQYLMKRKVTGLIGAPEAGKSSLGLKWGIHLVLDLPFGDFVPVPLPGEQRRPRRVGILNAEDDGDEQQRRISSMIRDTGRRVSDLADNLIRISPGGATAGLFTAAPDTGEVCTTQAFEDLKAFIKDRALDVLILDPLVELMGGLDENSNAIMGQVFAKLRGLAEECDIAILVVHHTRKGVAVPGNLEAARGAGALGGSIRIGLTLTVMREEEAVELGIPKETRKHYVRLDNAKQSYGPPSDGALWFQRFSIILDNGDSSPALEPWSPPKVKEMSLDELEPIVTAVKAGAPAGAPYSPKLSGDSRSVKHVLEAHGIAGKAAQDAAVTALRDKCGMLEADYQRRNDQGQKRGTGRGLRIGALPAVEWISFSEATGSSSSGSNDDED